jgi:hypothetical protein
VRHVVAWTAWWIALFSLWLLLVGEWNREQAVAAALAATLAAAGGELARTRTGFGARFPLRLVSHVPQALGMVVVDFGLLVWALLASIARRRIARGEFVSRELERGTWVVRSPGRRAWTALVASLSPNAYVVDVDVSTRRVLLHDLTRNRKSERPV